jgi:hypothetical protein
MCSASEKPMLYTLIKKNNKLQTSLRLIKNKVRLKFSRTKRLHFSKDFKKFYGNIEKFKSLFTRINNERLFQILNTQILKKNNLEHHNVFARGVVMTMG